jgi:uncharacterized protein (DUF2336 family)
MNRPNIPFYARAGVSATRQSLIDELEAAFASRDIEARVDILRRVTDLFVVGSEQFAGEQLALFDDVMCRLIDEIGRSARAAFGERLAPIANAPPLVSRKLALDDSIDVAGPLLLCSEQLDDETLIAGAKTKSQRHLLAISRRIQLSEGVTDVLVERGDRQVVVSTAANNGAKFSEFGYSKLVLRSESDGELALRVWSRPEVPREHLLALFAIASDAVRLQFEAADRKRATLVRDMIKRASDQIQATVRDRSQDFAAAEAQVRLLNQTGALTEHRLSRFAEDGRFDETAIALSLLTKVPIGVIERTLVHDGADQVLMLAKFAGLSWTTTRMLLLLKATVKGAPVQDIDECFASFNKLTPEMARTAIQFYRLRERAAALKAPPE